MTSSTIDREAGEENSKKARLDEENDKMSVVSNKSSMDDGMRTLNKN